MTFIVGEQEKPLVHATMSNKYKCYKKCIKNNPSRIRTKQ